jgi:hypothetical protein
MSRVSIRTSAAFGTSRPIASATFSGPTPKIVSDVGRSFWTRVGPAVMRACASTSRPRRMDHEPLRIDAGEPGESTPVAAGGL